MRQTREDFTDLLFDFVVGSGGGVDRGLVVAGTEVDGRALAQAVFVLGSETHVVEVAFFNRGVGRFAGAVDVVGANRQVAVADGHNGTEVEAITLDAFVILRVGERRVGVVTLLEVAEHAESIDATNLEALEVLAHQEGLGKAAVVVAAEVDDVAVFFATIRADGIIVLEFVGENRVQGAEAARKSRGSVAVDFGGAFTACVAAGFFEGVLSRNLQTGELRGLVRDHVVVAGGRGEAEDAAGAAVEGVSSSENEVIRAGARTNTTHAAHGKRTKVGVDGDGSFAVEERVGGLEFAGVGLEAVFELEANLHAVAEVFSALDAKTGSGVAARFHGERVGINLGFVANGDFVGLELKARVDLAVHRDVGGLNGESGSAENGDSDKRLLEHNLVIQIKGKIWESLLFAWLRGILGQEGAIRKKPPFQMIFVFGASACGTGHPAGMR